MKIQSKKRHNFIKPSLGIRYQNKPLLENKIKNLLEYRKSANSFFHQINIKVKANNIFCTFKNVRSKQLLYKLSTGTINLKTSKKTLKFNIRAMLLLFFKNIFKKLKDSIIIKIVAPKYLKKIIITQAQLYLKYQKNILLDVANKKCFNGCRPPKKIRKKRRIVRNIK